MSNIALQVERLTAGSIVSGANVIFDTVVFTAGNISYNTLTGVITFNEPGRYAVNWLVATQSSFSANGSVFAVASSQGDFLEGNSPTKAGEVSGIGIIDVATAPVTVSLENASTATVFYSSIVPLAATMVIIQDDVPETGPTGATGATGAQGDPGATGATGMFEPNPFEVYVQAGAVAGDGTQASPFGTIQEGVTAVFPTGTVYILGGTYPIASQIIINKAGITLRGYPNTLIELQAAVIPFLVIDSGITLDGLTITSDNPYAVEFIQFAGTNHKLVNSVIYGPPQAGPSTGWVVNRGFVTQGSVVDLIVQNTIFYSLRQPAYFNPNSTGHIVNNVVYNTRGWVVDQAIFVFSGNSWGLPDNAVDIALLTGTLIGPPYDPLVDLAASNSDATISDQRP